MKLLIPSIACNVFQNLVKFYLLFTIFLVHTQLSYGRLNWVRPNSSIVLSTPEECARICKNGEKPKNCYYKFHIEFYTTLGPACNVTTRRDQCVLGDNFEKTIIPINRELPGPSIEICLNDRVIVDVENAAPGNEVTIHWHGVFQNGYQYYDGVPYVTQCPIASSSTFRYDFVVKNSGTHFYHSHISTHMLDGQYGSFIVRDAPENNPHVGLYDEDNLVIFLSDWLHELSIERYPGYYLSNLGQTAQNILINGLGNYTDPSTNKTTNGKLTEFQVEKGKRYRVRVINSFSTVCLAELNIQGHNLTVIAQDGANVEPRPVDRVITATGERVDFIIHTHQEVDSYWIQVRGLGECSENKTQQFAILRYANGPSVPSTPRPSYDIGEEAVIYNSLNGTLCDTNIPSDAVCVNQLEGVTIDPDLLKVEPDARHILPFWFFNYTQYGDRVLFGTDTYDTFFDAADRSQLISTFNRIAFETPASPLLSEPSSYQTVCRKNQLSTCTQPCTCTQLIHAKLNSVVELIIYDEVPLLFLHHPFHLHGYEFKVFSIGQFSDNRNISAADINEVIKQHTQRLERGEYHKPPGKDTVKIPMGGYAIIRFKADNPGYWLIHCHFSWHHLTGMELVIHVGSPKDLPPVPEGFPQCDNWKPALHTLNDFYGFRYPSPI